jgi:hypothetical protein
MMYEVQYYINMRKRGLVGVCQKTDVRACVLIG